MPAVLTPTHGRLRIANKKSRLDLHLGRKTLAGQDAELNGFDLLLSTTTVRTISQAWALWATGLPILTNP